MIEYPYNRLTATDVDIVTGTFSFPAISCEFVAIITKVPIPSFLSALRVILFSDD